MYLGKIAYTPNTVHMKNYSLLNKMSNSSVFFGRKLNCIPHITYIIERCIEIIISVAIYIQQGLGWQDWQDNPTKSMLVINQIQTGLRLYCAWIGETIVPGGIESDRQPRFEIVLIGI